MHGIVERDQRRWELQNQSSRRRRRCRRRRRWSIEREKSLFSRFAHPLFSFFFFKPPFPCFQSTGPNALFLFFKGKKRGKKA
jgi:hypothetical protein